MDRHASEVVARIEIVPVRGIPEVRTGDDLTGLILAAMRSAAEALRSGDVVAIAQKVVSKAEGRVVLLGDVVPGERAQRMAAESGKDARLLEVVLGETKKIVRWTTRVLIAETHHGFVCANAGVDRSNAGAPDAAVLLPVDPDASAARIRDEIRARTDLDVAVIITDTFGRAWREGHANVAIGIAGLPALRRYLGEHDPHGYELRVTEIAIADEIAGAAELVMGKTDGVPAAIVRGLELRGDGSGQDLLMPSERDLFR